MKKVALGLWALAFLASGWLSPPLALGQGTIPSYQKDRGPGISTSMFGTYIQKGEWVIYPFFEYYSDRNFEYKPSELGYGLAQDFRGKYRGAEGLIFLGYGLSNRLVLEFEAAATSASLTKASSDPSGLPEKLTESGLGDVQFQLDFRLVGESSRRPEIYAFVEEVIPHHRSRPLIGTSDWETKAGLGLIRGFSWGTVTVRMAVEHAGGAVGLGEYAVEYFKRLSPRLRLYAGIEGAQDEVVLIGEVQWYLGDRVRIKVNNGFGLTSKATDFAPEIGIMFSIF
jgi:hypothetical protein